MADENEDQWLYGDSDGVTDNYTNEEQGENDETGNSENLQDTTIGSNDDGPHDISEASTKVNETKATSSCSPTKKSSEDVSTPTVTRVETSPKLASNGTKDPDDSNASDSDSDDDIHVVIGDIKSTPTAGYNSLNIKRGGLLSTSGPDNLKKQSGKFSIDDFETIGVINGMQAHEFNLDQLEDKPWRQPGADITDYFNYGFNEDTWRAYCERQKRMRSESGVGLVLNAGGGIGGSGLGNTRVPQVAITNDNSKYSGIMGPKRAGPPPGRKMAGTIDVIGSSGLASRRNLDKSPPKENVIQVMTADRREYSRKPAFPDMSVPPPVAGIPPTFDLPPPGYHINDPPPYFMPESDPYYQSYEPTQDSQWGNDPTWQPTNLAVPTTENENENGKDLGPKTIPTMVPPISITPLICVSEREQRSDSSARGMMERERSERDMESMGMERDRERERERGERDKDSVVRDRERDKDSISRDEDRERLRSQYRPKESRHRHRSRSRSRRHKSKSRSPSRRKKKSRRSDRERSKEESE